MTKLNVCANAVSPSRDPREIHITGRDAWALLELHKAGGQGCTPINNPAPRWSGYIHNLRHKFGLDIETVHERHGGQFAGRHARYILRSQVNIHSVDGCERSEAA